MGGSVVTSCSLHILLSTCVMYVLGCVLVRGQQKQTKFYRYVRKKQASHRETREIVLSTPVEKNFEGTPSELQCLDRAQTSTTGSGRPSCVDVYLAFWLKVLVRRDKFERDQFFTNIRIHTRLPFGEWHVPRGVTQVGMPQGKIINRVTQAGMPQGKIIYRHPAVPLVA